MSWRMDSSAGAMLWDTEPLGLERRRERDEEIRWLIAHERPGWGLINGRIKEKFDPTMYGTFAGLSALPPAATIPNVASISGEGSLYDVAAYTPWLGKSVVAPSAWLLFVSFQVITAATPASVTVNPRVGSFAAGASSTGGAALGADAAVTLTASITTNWLINGNITVRSVGAYGAANATAEGIFQMHAKPATAGNGLTTVDDVFGFTTASFDAGAAQGVALGMANTVTTINYSIRQIQWISLF